jgi:hypothetical protein
MIHCVHVAGAPTNGGFWWRLATYDETPVFSVSAGQPGFSLVLLGAPGAIRTPAHGSGGRSAVLAISTSNLRKCDLAPPSGTLPIGGLSQDIEPTTAAPMPAGCVTHYAGDLASG